MALIYMGVETVTTGRLPTRWVYETEDSREQLTVSLPLGSIRRLSKGEQSKTLRRLAELSRRAVTQVTDRIC